MMNNNKILTVSYGTFSCTLEGFDDSFGTMKAIAEYFRDLASHDRYFGAEPPQPDAEMLARIAQREVSRKVHAHERDGKIVLSALEDQNETAVENAPLDADVSGADVASNVAVAADTVAAQVTNATPKEAVHVDAEPNKVPAVSASESDVDLEAAVQAEQGSIIVEPSPIIEEVAPLQEPFDAAETAFVEDKNDIVPGQPDRDVEAFFADAKPQKTDDIATVGTPVTSAGSNTTNTIAAKLQRIRAVVAQNTDTSNEGGYAEDQHAEAKTRDVVSTDITTAALDDVEIVLDTDKTNISFSDEATAEPSIILFTKPETPPEITPEITFETAPETPVTPVDLPNSETGSAQSENDQEDNDVDAILKRLASATSADTIITDEDENDDLSLDADLENLFEDTIRADVGGIALEIKETADDVENDGDQGIGQDIEPTVQTPNEPAPRARVIKVKRAELEAAIRKGTLEEYDDDAEPDVPAQAAEVKSLDQIAPSRSRKTSLTPEDEQELVRELSELEMDIEAEQDDETADEPEIETHVEPIKTERRRENRVELAQADEGRNTDVNRLLAEADQQMDEPESATRRDAFTHLRAAVASQKAEVALGTPQNDEAEDDIYRDDLAKVVRPHRPESTGHRTARPTESRPAPLKLVAEQRIDVESARSEGPIRPRRVAVLEPAPVAQNEDSFADYATEMGAETLPQLLEAAASYMSFVEGRDQFSRPQLMTKVRQSGAQDDFSREDGLRSFGQLLRAGKISKIKGGRFTVSDDIGFQPDDRAAG
jgi:pilus assembly protein FimV